MAIRPLEADTRIQIDRSLENLGWISDPRTGKFQNVYREQPRTEEEKKNLRKGRPDYVLYSEEENRPLVIIEAKRPGEKIDKALEQGIGYAKTLHAPLVFATDGVFCKSFHADFGRSPLLNGDELDEFIRENLALKYLKDYQVNTISPKVQYDRKELIKIFDEANNMLRSEGLRAGIERFGEFANVLFLKLISENEDIKKELGEKTTFSSGCHWNFIKDLKKNDRISYINATVFDQLNKLYKTDIFTPLQIKDGEILDDIITKLDPLRLNDVDSDVKGDAFEYFLKESTASGNDLGEYFTPRNVVKTMVKLINPQIGEKVYDPFCGTGGLLIESFRYIWNTMARTESNIRTLREHTIYGNEITNTSRITKMNMILAGDGHSNINMCDSLANPIDDKYDIVITNMPYSQKTRHSKKYDIPSNNGDSICVQHCIRAINGLSENGRMALVVPEGFLFRKDLTRTREYLLDRCNLRSVISLPQGVFLPYTGVKTDILYCDQVKNENRKKTRSSHFWYFTVENDGYTLDSQRKKIDGGNDLEKYQEYRKLEEKQRDDMLEVGFESVPFEQVEENGFVLIGSRYRKVNNNLKSQRAREKLGNIFEVSKNEKVGSLQELPILSMTMDRGLVDQSEKFNKRVASDDISNYKKVYKNELVVGFPIDEGVLSFQKKYLYAAVSPSYGVWRVKKGLEVKANLKYLEFILRSKEMRDVYSSVMQRSVARRRSIPKEVFLSLEIPFPEVSEQNKIVEELVGYQKIIDGARLVVDNYTFNPLLSKDCKYETISDLCVEILGGGTPSTKEEKFWHGDIPWMTSADINEDHEIVIRKHITKSAIENSTSRIISAGNVIIASRVGLGKIALNTFDVAINQDLQGLFLDRNKVLPEFFKIVYSLITEELINKARGTTIKGITKDELRKLKLPIPDIAEQKKIIAQTEIEKALIEPSKQLVELFTKKLENRINELFK